MLIIRLEKQYRKTLDNKGLRMFTIAEAGPRLEGLKLSSATVGSPSISRIAEAGPRLEGLKLGVSCYINISIFSLQRRALA